MSIKDELIALQSKEGEFEIWTLDERSKVAFSGTIIPKDDYLVINDSKDGDVTICPYCNIMKIEFKLR